MNRFLFLAGLLAVVLGQQPDTTQEPGRQLPPVRSEPTPELLPEGKPFYDYKPDLEHLRSRLDSLKKIISVYEQKQALPVIDKQILEMVPIPADQHRITLQNGTTVVGTILGETEEGIVLETGLGRLVIRRDLVIRMDEQPRARAQVVLVEEPRVSVTPDQEIVTGSVRNDGQLRADFVRVLANLWTSTTTPAGSDSAFIRGQRVKYESGVISDTALEPGAVAPFRIEVPLKAGLRVEYRTFDIHWTETR